MPEMHFVDSSNVEAIGYDPEARELHVHFIKSANYVYVDVEEWVFNEFYRPGRRGNTSIKT